jgi:uncharacterized membrane protein YqgA involved in biofilm formation
MSTIELRRPPVLLVGTARAVTAGFAVVAAGLAAQLWRYDALAGGAVAKQAIPRDGHGWRFPHFVANGVSVVGGTAVVPALLLTLAAVVAVRIRRLRPLLVSVAAVVVVSAVVAIGKLTLGGHLLSGPATVTIVGWGVAGWLVHDQLDRPVRGALHWLAGSAALLIGVAQLYLGHPFPAVLLSWLVGAAVLGALALVVRPRRSPAGESRRPTL